MRLACLDPLSLFLARIGYDDGRIGSGDSDDAKICMSSDAVGRRGVDRNIP